MWPALPSPPRVQRQTPSRLATVTNGFADLQRSLGQALCRSIDDQNTVLILMNFLPFGETSWKAWTVSGCFLRETVCLGCLPTVRAGPDGKLARSLFVFSGWTEARRGACTQFETESGASSPYW